MTTVMTDREPAQTAVPAPQDPGALAPSDIAVPTQPLSRRVRAWLFWLLIMALLAWSWAPAEMFRVSALFTDWRNMAEFGNAFLKPNFHDWDVYLADMLVTIQIAVWGTSPEEVDRESCRLSHPRPPGAGGGCRAGPSAAGRSPRSARGQRGLPF